MSERNTPLIEAVLQKDLERVKQLIAEGADRNVRNADGKRACDLAASLGYDLILIHLIDGGCGG